MDTNINDLSRASSFAATKVHKVLDYFIYLYKLSVYHCISCQFSSKSRTGEDFYIPKRMCRQRYNGTPWFHANYFIIIFLVSITFPFSAIDICIISDIWFVIWNVTCVAPLSIIYSSTLVFPVGDETLADTFSGTG